MVVTPSEEMRRAAIVQAAAEVQSRQEPWNACPEIASIIRARKPSELPEYVENALVAGYRLQADLEPRRGEVLNVLERDGFDDTEAREFFNAELYRNKWQAIAQIATRGA